MNSPEPKTLAERLDAAETGEEFGNIVLDLFGYLDSVRDDD